MIEFLSFLLRGIAYALILWLLISVPILMLFDVTNTVAWSILFAVIGGGCGVSGILISAKIEEMHD